MSFEELPNPPVPDFLRAREVANKTLSRREATVRTPPTIAHVLMNDDVGITHFGNRMEDIRCDKMSERLSRIRVYDKNGRDFIVEEGTRKALCTMMNMNTLRGFSRTTLRKITLKVSDTILMSIDLDRPQSIPHGCDSICRENVQFFHPLSGIASIRP